MQQTRNQDIIKYRHEHNIFTKSIENRSKEMQIVTYDGPPFASGTPHYGHGLVSIMKDTLSRFKTMQGYRVERKRWRDCHGLPVEKFVEKKLGIDGKKDIEKIGIKKFIEECRASVRDVNSERKSFVTNIWRRTDIDNAYYTMDLEFMESVMRVFSNLYNQNLVYKGFSIQGYCPSCATGLSNSEINDWYKDRQDPAITVKFELIAPRDEKYESTSDACIKYVQAVITYKNHNKILAIYSKKKQARQFPGSKIHAWQTAEQTLSKIVYEQLGVHISKQKILGSKKYISSQSAHHIYIYEIEIDQEPINKNLETHPYIEYAEILPRENRHGFAYKIQDNIISEEEEIRESFHELLSYQELKKYKDLDKAIYFLAWTTTPRTLPSNMFLAVGSDIKYVQIYDLAKEEYYILAYDLLKKYYTNSEDYLLVSTFLWKDLSNYKYKPLFDYYHQDPSIHKKYKDEVHQVLQAEFVSIESGTGIVHLAPAFWQDDFNAVINIFPKDKANERLFMPLDIYGEFTIQVPELQGIRAYEANKDVINILKQHNQLLEQKTYNHSYPHCRRCDTPLIYKAMNSWFIKEQSIAQQTIPAIEQIKFIPDTVKNRFRDTLNSAPDRNVSRDRYRWAPIPIRESTNDPDQRIIVNTLDELYYYTKTGSKNISKHVMIRHAHTDYNAKDMHDNLGIAKLDKIWKEQAQHLANELISHLHDDDYIIVLSPLPRVWETILPFLVSKFSPETIAQRHQQYLHIYKQFQDLRNQEKIISYIQDPKTQKHFIINEHLCVDFRITDMLIPDYQGQKNHSKFKINHTFWEEKLSPYGESLHDMQSRIRSYHDDMQDKHRTKTLISVSHETCLVFMKQIFKNFDYDTHREKYIPDNTSITTYYRDLERNVEIDLHKPYIDNYWFHINWHTFHRVPEVLDCWFESGSMPYGQSHYVGNKDIAYPADFIIEGLDQTRGRFRTLHVLGHGIMDTNAFNNIIINGLVLAEDGKKMSKKLKNYPDPQKIFDKYGADPIRMVMLTSPAVRGEPVKLSESAIEQMYKDFVMPINNAYNFFSTYAKIDQFTALGTNAYFIYENNTIADPQDIIRLDADVICYNHAQKQEFIANKINNIYQHLQNKTVTIRQYSHTDILEQYEEILEEHQGKNIIFIGGKEEIQTLRKNYYHTDKLVNPSQKIIQLPTYHITSDLDKRIIAELHDLIDKVQEEVNSYTLDAASKEIMNFVEKLTNRYIRRSRRRFRASDMGIDKLSAYHTLYTTLEQFMRVVGPFAPFIAEKIRLELKKFLKNKSNGYWDSVHLQYIPLCNDAFIDKTLLQEIKLVRRFISQGLYIRSKNNIKIKQPLSTMHIYTQ